MGYYFVMLVIVIIVGYYAKQSLVFGGNSLSQTESYRTPITVLCLVIIIISMTFLAAVRYHVGTDFKSYEVIYYQTKDTPFSIQNLTDEPVTMFIAKLCAYFSDNVQWFFIVFSALTIVPVLVSSYRETDDYIFVTLLLVFIGWWTGTFNGMRQYLAITVIYCGRKFIKERSLTKYLLVCAIAYLCHKSSIVMVALYFLPSPTFRPLRVVMVVVASVLLSRSTEILFEVVGFLNNREFVSNSYAATNVSFFRIAVGCVPAALALYCAYTRELDNDQYFYMYMLVANATLRVMTSNSAYLARIASFPGVFVPIGLSRTLESFDEG